MRTRAPWLALVVPAVLWGALQVMQMAYRSRGENVPEPLVQAVIALSALAGVAVVVAIVIAVAFRPGRTAEKVLTRRFPHAFIVRAVKEYDLVLGLRMLASVAVDTDALENRVKRLFPLVLTGEGVEFWTSDDDPALVTALPWSAIGGACMGTISRPGRESRAVMLDVNDASRSVTLPFVVLPQRGSGISFLGPALDELESKLKQRGRP
jgi:hypothetical protein